MGSCNSLLTLWININRMGICHSPLLLMIFYYKYLCKNKAKKEIVLDLVWGLFDEYFLEWNVLDGPFNIKCVTPQIRLLLIRWKNIGLDETLARPCAVYRLTSYLGLNKNWSKYLRPYHIFYIKSAGNYSWTTKFPHQAISTYKINYVKVSVLTVKLLVAIRLIVSYWWTTFNNMGWGFVTYSYNFHFH